MTENLVPPIYQKEEREQVAALIDSLTELNRTCDGAYPLYRDKLRGMSDICGTLPGSRATRHPSGHQP
jgi:hypothetical protein